MINKIKIKNFQSHENTELELNDGVNVIIGNSNNGKTAIIRALNWVINNKPRGDGFVSNWCFDEKGKQNKKTNVQISSEKGRVQRYKDDDGNGYKYDGVNYCAVSSNVPVQVQDFFNFNEVNIQKQHEPHFLLSQTSGEISRFFNKLINMDIIDNYFKKINSMRIKNSTEIKWLETEIEDMQKELKNYDYLECLGKKICRLEKISNRLQRKIDENTGIVLILGKLKIKIEEVQEVEKILKVKNKYLEFEKIVEDLRRCNADRLQLIYFIEKTKEHTKKIEQSVKIIEQKNIIDKGQKIVKQVNIIQERKCGIDVMLGRIDFNQIIVDNMEKHILELQKEYEKIKPDVCPICNRPF